MISRKVEIQVRRLLAAGKWSRRRIAERLGISRATVTTIARCEDLRTGPRGYSDDPLAAQHRGPLRRCLGCGRLVCLPCQACRADLVRKSNPLRTPPEREPPDERELGVNLEPEERDGYRRIRRRKTREER